MTMTLPLRLMILHFSHMGFTDGLTFMLNLLIVNALMAPTPPQAVDTDGKAPTAPVVDGYFVLQVIRPRVTS